LLFLNLSYF